VDDGVVVRVVVEHHGDHRIRDVHAGSDVLADDGDRASCLFGKRSGRRADWGTPTRSAGADVSQVTEIGTSLRRPKMPRSTPHASRRCRPPPQGQSSRCAPFLAVPWHVECHSALTLSRRAEWRHRRSSQLGGHLVPKLGRTPLNKGTSYSGCNIADDGKLRITASGGSKGGRHDFELPRQGDGG
jgi:hypothetical protein